LKTEWYSVGLERGIPTNSQLSLRRTSIVADVRLGRSASVAAFAIAVIILLTGCAGQAVDGTESLRRAVDRFWTLRMEKEYGKIYDEILDLETRQAYHDDRAAFIRSKGSVDFLAYEIVDISVEGEQGWAEVRYTWTGTHPAFQDRPPGEDSVRMNWILEDGKWRKKYVPPAEALRSRKVRSSDKGNE
jgi:hypothetical protein